MRYLDRFFQPDNWEEDVFTSKQGKKIRYGHAEPEGEVKGAVVITTGYADFIESYHETIHDYLDRGYSVWIMDWAGQGGSDKKRDDTVKAQVLDDHVRDLHQFRHDIVKPEKGKPVFASTHSMGGQIVLQYLSQYKEDFDFAVLAAPLVDFHLKGVARGLLQAAFRSAVNLGLGDQSIKGGRRGITKQVLAERKRLRAEDPVRMDLHRILCLMNKQLRAEDPTFGLIDSLFESTAKMNEKKVLSDIKTPVLFGIAGKDDIVDNAAIHRAVSHMPNARSAVVENATHDMWHERQNQRLDWWKNIDVFLKEQHQRLDAAPDAHCKKASAPKKPSLKKPKGPFAA